MKDLLMGFVEENGYETHERPIWDDEQPAPSNVRVEVLVDGSRALACTFDSFGDLVEMESMSSSDLEI
ncbi:hypothetical protein PINS_up013868 [Pythium insidiosum]|nr:hypothetical protein PINS_up013868 [Pythium insidiosum]